MTDTKFNFGVHLKEQGDVAAPFDVTLRNVSRQVKTGKNERLTLLDDVSLYFKPRTMTLVLGAPGCGKTTLFKVLANHGKKKKKYQTGQVQFNGQPASSKTHDRSVAYVTQEDIHFPTLTVRETLQFSIDCQVDSSVSNEDKAKKVDLLLRLLDLQHVQDTFVGNGLIRGISGGQKKRVTIGVSLTTSPSLILMDEPSTGLDANTALEVISSMRTVCDELSTPVVASLLQPSPEICNLFDNLLILSKGRVAYFGSYQNAIPYFSRHGLVGDKFQSDPEFLQEAVEFSHKYSSKTADEMVTIYRESPEYQDTLRVLGAQTNQLDNNNDSQVEKAYVIPFAKQVQLNMKRDFTMTRRNVDASVERIMQKIVMGLIMGSLFFNLPNEQAGLRTRMGVMFFSIIFLAFGNIGLINPFYRERPVFYMQREQKYYSPIAYFVSKTLLELPFVVVECIIYSSIIYWMVGLRSDAGRFLFYYLVVMCTDFFSIVFCRCISTFIATQQVAVGITPSIFGTLAMFTGFIVPPQSIPGWWIWLYYLSPFHYALEACMINELVGTSFHCKASERLPPPSAPEFSLPYPQGFSNNYACLITEGEQELHALKMHTEWGWRWAHVAILLAFTAFLLLLTFFGAVKVHHPTRVIQKSTTRKTSEGVQLEVSADQIPESQKGKGAFMSWENLTYSVEVTKDKKKEQLVLLEGITGYVRPGMLMALMGPSGAGKSTLLDVLANRKTGGITTGNILINSAPRDKYFSRFSAYVEQQDILAPLATVYETVLFSAQVRLPRERSKKEIELTVKDTMQLLDLDSIQNMYAGGLSMEQRKRLTIAVELVADPQLLFLDEPTSGLDSQAAMRVMEVVKRVADTGRAVLCTIHQPSISVFSYFDHLLLLKRGGKTIYFGPTGNDCSTVLEYFSSIGWECGTKRNPADFILDAAAATDTLPDKQQDPEAAFAASVLKKEMESHLADIPAGFQPPNFNKKYASSFLRQLECNLRREWANVRRRTEDIRARIIRSVLLGVIMGTLFLQIDHSQQGSSDRFGLLFFALIITGTSSNHTVPNIVDGRAVFYREQAAGAYRSFAYLIGIIATELPLTMMTSLSLATLIYFLSGLVTSASHFFFFAWIIFLYGALTANLTMFLSLATPSGEIADNLVGVFTFIFALFSGFIITRPNIPNYWIWMHYLDVMFYPLEAVVINEMENTWFGCHNGKGAVEVRIPEFNTTKLYCPVTDGNQILNGLEFHANDKFRDMGITIAFWFALASLCYIALRYIRHIKR